MNQTGIEIRFLPSLVEIDPVLPKKERLHTKDALQEFRKGHLSFKLG
jgi:hypothetical protein